MRKQEHILDYIDCVSVLPSANFDCDRDLVGTPEINDITAKGFIKCMPNSCIATCTVLRVNRLAQSSAKQSKYVSGSNLRSHASGDRRPIHDAYISQNRVILGPERPT